jgi:hypothetical protein
MKTRPVFESYEEFVYAIKNAINEAEETGNIDAINKLIGGGFKMDGTKLSRLKEIVTNMNNMMTPDAASEFKEWAQNISDYFSSGEAGVKLKGSNILNPDSEMTKFEWLVNGTVRVKGQPTLDPSGTINTTGGREDDSSINTPISDILRGIFAYNLAILSEMVDSANREDKDGKIWKDSNGGSKGKGGYKYPYLAIDPKSLEGDIIQVIPYTGKLENENVEFGVEFPIYTAKRIVKGGGELLGTETYEEVIKPAGNDTEVTDKPYNSSGVDFFAENAVVIGEDGIASLKSIISEFNSITTIKVNGGASKKPTTRAGGNEQLAKDRQSAGIKALQELQKAGVEQLKGAKIEAGETKVQDAAEENDPKNQQVSFIISGMIKNVSGPDNKEIIIKKVKDLRADGLILSKYLFQIYFDIV